MTLTLPQKISLTGFFSQSLNLVLGIFISHTQHRISSGRFSFLPQTRQFEGKNKSRKSMNHRIPFRELMACPTIYQPTFW